MESFVFEQKVLEGLTFCDFGPKGSVPQGGARGQNLGHLQKNFAFIFLLCNHS